MELVFDLFRYGIAAPLRGLAMTIAQSLRGRAELGRSNPRNKTMPKLLIYSFLVLSFVRIQTAASQPEEKIGHLEKVSLSADNPYAKIDLKDNNEAMDVLIGSDPELKAAKADEVLAHPEKYNPPVLYMLSYVLFQQGRKDEAMFWFYAGQLRGRFDANRCADISARSAVAALNQKIGPYVNPYAFQDIDKLKATVAKVMEWDKATPHLYDHRWVNLHGMESMNWALKSLGGAKLDPAPVMSLPESEWEDIHRKTQEEYMSGFKEALEILKERQEERRGHTPVP